MGAEGFGSGFGFFRVSWGELTLRPTGLSEALRLLQEAGLGGQRHQGRGQAPEAHPRAKAEVRCGQQGLEDADKAEGGAAVGDEVDLVAVRAQEGRGLLQSFGPRNKNVLDHLLYNS